MGSRFLGVHQGRPYILPLKGIRVGGLEVDVEVEELFAQALPCVEVVVEGQAGELAEEVDGVLFAVLWVVEDGVGVGEDALGGDGLVAGETGVVVAPQGALVVVDVSDSPIGDVADALAVGSVAVEREALGLFEGVVSKNPIGR